jgi:hypothetical protein
MMFKIGSDSPGGAAAATSYTVYCANCGAAIERPEPPQAGWVYWCSGKCEDAYRKWQAFNQVIEIGLATDDWP